MNNLFTLSTTYELLLEFKDTSRPVRIEVFRSVENPNIYRARVWDQNTYNLYPTFVNIDSEDGLQNKMLSCDEVNREITNIVAKEPTLITGKEYPGEKEFVEYVKSLVLAYQATLSA